MDLRQMRMVLAVADHGSFSAAARALDIAQPSLSQAVRTLEHELGAELFRRLPRGVVLTPAGEAFVVPARQAVRDAATARALVAETAGLQRGRLDLVCLPTLAVDPVAGLVGAFRAAHGAVAVRIVEPEDAGALIDRLRDGSSEIGVTELHGGRPATAQEDELVSVALGDQDYLAVLPPGPRSAPAGPVTLERLARLPLITTPPGTSTRRQVEDAFADRGLVPEVAVETDHREGIVAMVLAGAGVSILPAALAADADRLGAVVRPTTPRIRRGVGLVHRPGPLSPGAAAFRATALGEVAERRRPPARRRRT